MRYCRIFLFKKCSFKI